MLVVSRKLHESIVIGDNVRVVVVDNDRHGKIRLGIEAPPEVKIYRREVLPPDHPLAQPPAPPAADRVP